jgi:hypothetical protein
MTRSVLISGVRSSRRLQKEGENLRARKHPGEKRDGGCNDRIHVDGFLTDLADTGGSGSSCWRWPSRGGAEDVPEVSIFEWELREETKSVEIRCLGNGADRSTDIVTKMFTFTGRLFSL